MDYQAMDLLLSQSMKPQELEKSIAYVSQRLKICLFPKEEVLICFHHHIYGNISYVMEQAVLQAGGIPILMDQDFRWISLLRLAFSKHVGCVIGPPLILLGLSKVAKAMHTPLFIRDAVLAGYPCLDWMLDGIRTSLDCRAWGCFNMGQDGMVCGFSCECSSGVHLRDDVYGLEIVDHQGNRMPPGALGQMRIYSKENPQLSCLLPDQGVLEPRPCVCGSTSPRVLHICPIMDDAQEIFDLGQRLQSWTSILDCRIDKGPGGLEIDLIYFSGERLPKLPSAAKLNMQPWNLEKDKPFWYFPISKNPDIFLEKY